jgi:protein-S-isoprenylcysteine O-methyltransferase Ste14
MGFLDYFQLATIVIVLSTIASKAIYSWSVTGIFPIVIGRGKGVWRIIELLSLLALIVLVGKVLLRAFHSRFDIFPGAVNATLLHSQAVRTLGLVLVTLGLILFILAFLNFGTSWRIGIDRKTPGQLVTGGIFATTRNPIYVAFIAILFGIFLINGTWFFLIFALLAVVAIHFQILREEGFLKKQYGDSYNAYCARVARYLLW